MTRMGMNPIPMTFLWERGCEDEEFRDGFFAWSRKKALKNGYIGIAKKELVIL